MRRRMPQRRTTETSDSVGLRLGFRSGLEDRAAAQLKAAGQTVRYEQVVIEYEVPSRKAKYKPDFVLDNGIIIETKGRFVTADRQKHKLIKAQRPDLDIRFVFTNPNTRISKTSKTTYAKWCEDHGFQYAKGTIPEAWLKESKPQ